MPVENNADTILQQESAKMRRLIDYRRPYDAKRSLLYRQYLGQRDALMFPDGVTQRANTFAQYPWSNVETIVSRVHDAYFSYDDWFETRGVGANDSGSADNMTTVLKKMLKDADLISAVEDLVRTIAIYGHGGLKVDWDWGYDVVTYKEPVPAIDPETQQLIIDPNTGQPIILGYKPASRQIPRNRPRFTPIDIFDLYVDPDGLTAAVVFDRTLGQLKAEYTGYKLTHPDEGDELYYAKGLQELENKLAKEKDPDSVIIRVAELWDYPANTVTIVTAQDVESIAWKERRASYRFASYGAFRRKVYGGPAVMLYTGANQFNHKRIPILHTSYVRLPNEPYGIGAIEPISEMTEAMSQFINMIRDNWNLGINRRYAYDVNANIDHDSLNRFNTPGGKVAVDGDPSKILMPLPTHTPDRGDYSIIELYKNLIETTSGISDFYSGRSSNAGGNTTATGITSIIGESNFKFRMFIRNLEVYIMQPLLKMCSSMVQQYLSDQIEVLITDEPPAIPKAVNISPEELIGNFSFDLVAANYVTNEVVKQRNLLAFQNLAVQSPFWNQYEGLKELAKVFKIPNRNRLLKTPEVVAEEQRQQLEQQLQLEQLHDLREHNQRLEEIKLTGKMAAEKARATASSKEGGSDKKDGRPRTRQFEGPIPGSDITTVSRELGQADGIGMRGLGSGNMGGG